MGLSRCAGEPDLRQRLLGEGHPVAEAVGDRGFARSYPVLPVAKGSVVDADDVELRVHQYPRRARGAS